MVIRLRNLLYDRGILKSKRLPVPVICVGNLSLGGSGKTSLVRHLADRLSERFRVAIVMRGYKRRSRGLRVVSHAGELLLGVDEAGDEAYMLSRLLRSKGVSVVVSEDRYEGGLVACGELGAQLILLDDGFQHRRLYRDLDVVLLKKRDLKDRVFPLGRLREPLDSLKRASCIVLSYQEVEPFDFSFRDKPVFKMFRRFVGLVNANLEKVSPRVLSGRRVIAFAGLGDNRQFFKSLKMAGIRVDKEISFRDHHDYRNFKLDGDSLYITTLKDMVKLPKADNLYALELSVEVNGLEDFLLSHL